MSEAPQWPLPADAPRDPLKGVFASVEEVLRMDETRYRVIQMARKEGVGEEGRGHFLEEVLDLQAHERVLGLIRTVNQTVRIAFLIPGYEDLFFAYASTGWNVIRDTRNRKTQGNLQLEEVFQGWGTFVNSIISMILMRLEPRTLLGDGHENTKGFLGEDFLAIEGRINTNDFLISQESRAGEMNEDDPRRLYLLPKSQMEKRFDDSRWKEVLELDADFAQKLKVTTEFFRMVLIKLISHRLEIPGTRKFYKAGVILPTDRAEDYLELFEGIYDPHFPKSICIASPQNAQLYLTLASSDASIENGESFGDQLLGLVSEKVNDRFSEDQIFVQESVSPLI